MGKNDKIQEAGNSPALLELQRIGANSAVTDTPSASMLFLPCSPLFGRINKINALSG
jgi:hypothetical protein